MYIPVEQIGSEFQRIPAALVKIENSSGTGLIRYSSRDATIRVPLSEVQLAPRAFELATGEAFHQKPSEDEESSPNLCRNNHDFSPREPVEVWLSHEATAKKSALSEESEGGRHEQEHVARGPVPSGAWWPGRVLNVQGGFAHVEVAAPLTSNEGAEEVSPTQVVPHLVRLGSSSLPYRSTLVKLEEIRLPWNGRPVSPSLKKGVTHTKETSEPTTLTTQGVLHRHTICIPAYLARLATSPDAHSALVKFCEAPCLIQCDPEPFLRGDMARRIMTSTESAVASGRQTPNNAGMSGCESDSNIASVAISLDSPPSASLWPSPSIIAQSSVLNAPKIIGTLSPAGVTDPALLLEGLPGANGPLVLLHIWSGSAEAIRRASLLELAHVRILVFRYHVMRKLSNGEPGELDLADSTDAPTENGDAPVMHCRPISIPILPNTDEHQQSTGDQTSGGMMIGYRAQFRIQPRLVGLAIGYHGSTIQEARGLPGVRAVDLLQDGIVQVEAETVEACQSVRNLLDFTEAEIPVSPRLASRLIGSKGMNIRKLASSAGVRRAQLLDPLTRKRRHEQQQKQASLITSNGAGLETESAEEQPASVELKNVDEQCDDSTGDDEKLPPPAFYLLGTRPAVAKMKLLLEFQADNWNELDELEETRRSLFSQLQQSNQPPLNGLPGRGGGASRVFVRGQRMPGRGGSIDGSRENNGPNRQPARRMRGGQPAPRGGRGERANRQQNGGVLDNNNVDGQHDTQFASHESSVDACKEEQVQNDGAPVSNPTNAHNGRGSFANRGGGRGRNRPRNNPVSASS
ncbi:unnamed protein product [Calicophoron daubneyi]|uniref:Uncharacterized protein n=1 Tax=Calicophoron daubneyi TaxID=300641 RepID=A0AAV2TCA8_CALDB